MQEIPIFEFHSEKKFDQSEINGKKKIVDD